MNYMMTEYEEKLMENLIICGIPYNKIRSTVQT